MADRMSPTRSSPINSTEVVAYSCCAQVDTVRPSREPPTRAGSPRHAQSERQPAQRRRVTIGGACQVANRRDPAPRRASCWRRRRPWSCDRVAGVRRERRFRTNSSRWRSRTDRPRRGGGLLHRRWGSRSWCNSAYRGAYRGGVESRCPSPGRSAGGFRLCGHVGPYRRVPRHARVRSALVLGGALMCVGRPAKSHCTYLVN
jgi:hypothetical protein